MIKKMIFCLALLGVFVHHSKAQEVTGGFKAGLNFSQLDGPSETDANGNELEDHSNATGFHIGALVNFKFTDIFALRTELLYSQKGTEYRYDGDSYLRLFADNGTSVTGFGTRKEALSITNSYIDLPVTAVVRFGRFEASAGMNVAVMVASNVEGEISFEGTSAAGQRIDPIIIAVDGNYLQDSYSTGGSGSVTTRTIDNRSVRVPEIVNAYYDANNADEGYFNRIDYGLIGGLNVFLNRGLNVGVRMSYGLADVTNEKQDVSRNQLNNGEKILQDDKDRMVSLQLNLGFSF